MESGRRGIRGWGWVAWWVGMLVLLAVPARGELIFDADAALALSRSAIGGVVSGEHRLINQRGEWVRLSQFRGKPVVISMIYTSCFEICSFATRHLAGQVEKARKAAGAEAFHVLSVGFDVPKDTPTSLTLFAKQQGVADDPRWQWLTGDRETLSQLARELGFTYVPSPRGFDHLVQATILDGEGKVYRQVYGDVFDTPLLVQPLLDLSLGRPQPDETVVGELVRRVRLFCTVYDPHRDAYRFDYSIFIGMAVGASILFFGFRFWWRERRRGKAASQGTG
ncbi:MAG: SCO family protein [Magnetococcales bacterium]|nr:SCO family protein [Magnetococcales bacterium]